MLEHAITFATMLTLGLMFGRFFYTVCFMICFFSLRKRTGGFHANKFWHCYIGTVICYIAIIQIVPILSQNTSIMYGLLFIAIVIICIIGTINHPNIDMSKCELKESKKSSRLVVLMELMVLGFLMFLKIDVLYIGYMSSAIILCAFLMCLAKFVKQEVCLK